MKSRMHFTAPFVITLDHRVPHPISCRIWHLMVRKSTMLLRLCLFALCISSAYGGWNNWNSWTSCNTNSTCQCGYGTQERVRSCNTPASTLDETIPCLGSGKEVKECEIKGCKCGYSCLVPLRNRAECGPTNKTETECPSDKFCCYDYSKRTCYKANIATGEVYELAEWGAWSKCQGECKRGLQTRDKKCVRVNTTVVSVGEGIESSIQKRGWGWGWLKLMGRNDKCGRTPFEKRRCKLKCKITSDTCSLDNSYTYFKDGVNVTKGYTDPHVLTKLGKLYEISFSFKAFKKTEGSIILVRAKRVKEPYLWFGKYMPLATISGTMLRLQLPVATRDNTLYWKDVIHPGFTYRVTIKQIKKRRRYFVTAQMTSNESDKLYSKYYKNPKPEEFHDVKVYAINELQRAADAQVKDLIIKGICESQR